MWNAIKSAAIPSRKGASKQAEPSSNPLDWELSSEEQAIWDEFPRFREEHPIHLAAKPSSEVIP